MFMSLLGPIRQGARLQELVLVGNLEVANPFKIPYDTSAVISIANGLDRIAEKLDGKEVNGRPFKVVRNPLVMLITDQDGPGYESGELLSYNNCLIEVFSSGEKQAFLPRYAPVDSLYYEQNKVIFEQFDFKCHRDSWKLHEEFDFR